MDLVKSSILIVLAVIVLLVATGGAYANSLLEAKMIASTDINDDDDEKLPFNAEISIDIFNSVVHVSHLVFHSDLIFEFDLPVINAIKAHSVFETSLNFTKYYRTLFRSIISPNAP